MSVGSSTMFLASESVRCWNRLLRRELVRTTSSNVDAVRVNGLCSRHAGEGGNDDGSEEGTHCDGREELERRN